MTARFDLNLKVSKLVFSDPIVLNDTCLKSYTGWQLNDTVDSKTYSCDEIGCEIVDITSNGFSIRFNSQYSIIRGELVLVKSSCFQINKASNKARFSAYPIVIPDVSNSQSPAAVKLAGEAVNTMSRLRVPIALILIMIVGPIAASILDQISSLFFMLLLIEGELVVSPDALLRDSLFFGLLPFDLPKVFAKWDQTATCSMSSAFDRNGLSCSIFGNYGEDLIVLMVTLAINIVVSLTIWCIVKALTRPEPPVDHKTVNAKPPVEKISDPNTEFNDDKPKDFKNTLAVLKTIDKGLGYSFSLAKLYGNMLPLLTFVFYNLSVANMSSVMLVGCFVSLIVIGFTIYMVVCLIYIVFWIRGRKAELAKLNQKHRSMHDSKLCGFGITASGDANNSAKKEFKSLVDTISLDDIPGFVSKFDVFFEEYCDPSSTWLLLEASLQIVRSAIMAACLAFLRYRSEERRVGKEC